jgi:RNA ligase
MLKNIDWNIIKEYANENLIRINSNYNNSLFILNYTSETQFKKHWDIITMNCRGLIVDNDGNIVKRCIPKFFNLHDYKPEEIPYHKNYEIQEKYDGVYGVLYKENMTYKIATRGSFYSNYTIEATKILYKDKYKSFLHKINDDYTYIFEIIYPENQIVVKYNEQKLVLLTVFETKTGMEIPLDKIDFPDKAKVYKNLSFNDFEELRTKYEEENREGFVVKFEDGFRIKVKFDNYFKLHKIVTKLSVNTIWEMLMNNENIDEIIKHIPKNHINFVQNTIDMLTNQYNKIEMQVFKEYQNAPMSNNRKEFALWAKQKKYPFLLFAIKDKKDIKPLIWKILKPKSNQF